MTRRAFWLLALVLGLVVTGFHNASAGEAAATLAIGAKAQDGSSLRDLRGNRRSLHSFKSNRALVLAFLGTECPLSNLYLPRLIELEKRYPAKQVQFLALYANEHEDLDQVAMHSYDRDVPFPVLKDFGQRLADSLGVTREGKKWTRTFSPIMSASSGM